MGWQILIILSSLMLLCTGEEIHKEISAAKGNKIGRLPDLNTCGKSTVPLRPKIIGGQPAKLGAYPWMAVLGFKQPEWTDKWFCGGTLITNQHVITAAHCVNPPPPQGYSSYMVIRLGELDLNETISDGAHPIDVAVANVTSHPGYNDESLENDIAIIKLQEIVQFTDLLKPICLPAPEFRTNMFVGYFPTIAGWGKSKNWTSETISSHLLEADIKIHDIEECKQNVTKELTDVVVDKRLVCAGSDGRDTCQGDSGGPLMFYKKPTNAATESTGNTYLMGITSFGYKCAEPGFPGLYTRVAHHMPWIIENLDI